MTKLSKPIQSSEPFNIALEPMLATLQLHPLIPQMWDTGCMLSALCSFEGLVCCTFGKEAIFKWWSLGLGLAVFQNLVASRPF